ncbi:restriction endonuclease subunit S [Photobacterium damselae]|uniref:Restriction endonuclease subunit S n=1 Tax=Photobacterium damselae TaxID=38293 RepID=A0ABD6WZS0_PHODM|nr:restriction endonuclease subunit S [Photobacterium damselae]OBU38732.1 type I restriction endonuclease subunit S [Photobacterium damselae]PSU15253.1 restriction endonuclease subunit S [Photobacterium damselae]
MSKVALSGKYRAYPEYKDSGVEWLGDIPLNWSVCRLKQMLSSPMSYGANEAAERAITSEPRYIRITDMNNDGSLKNDTFRSLPWDVANQYLLKDLDILLARSGATVGKSFIYRKDFGNCCYAGYLIKASCDSAKLNPEYAFWFFQSAQYWQYISSSQIQATIQNVSAEKYGEMYLPLPSSINEQNQIAAFLDHETAKIDTLIEKQQKLIELLKEKRQAVISHAVTKGLNPDAPMKDSGVEWLGEVPEHWGVSRLKYHCSVKGRIGFRGYTVEDLVDKSDGALVLGATEMTINGDITLNNPKYISWRKYYESPEIMLQKGMILVVQRGSTVGKIAHIDKELGMATINPSLVLLRDLKINSKFITYSLMGSLIQHKVKMQTSSTAIPMISQEQIGNYVQLLPSHEEQQQIVNYISQNISKINDGISSSKKSIKLMQERRTALISAAVTGKIDVRNWVAPTTNSDENEAAQEVTA